MNGIDLFSLQNIQQRIDKARLGFGLEIPQNSMSKRTAREDNQIKSNETHIFQIQFSLSANVRIGVKSGLYAVPESCNIHLASTGAPKED